MIYQEILKYFTIIIQAGTSIIFVIFLNLTLFPISVHIHPEIRQVSAWIPFHDFLGLVVCRRVHECPVGKSHTLPIATARPH